MNQDNSAPRHIENRPPIEKWGSRTFLFLFHDFWFRWFTITAAVIGTVAAVFLPKIWITTPVGFFPPLKSSGLDLLQAWNLKRRALERHAAGNTRQAVDAWTIAELNNGGDPTIPRGALQTLLQDSKPHRDLITYGYERSVHLLRLTGTNSADLELVAKYFNTQGIHPHLRPFIKPGLASVGPETAAALLATAFDERDMVGFGKLWERFGPHLSNHPPSRLRYAAWAAEWGPVSGAASSRRELINSQKDPTHRDLANQLLLTVHAQRDDLAAFRATLQDLEERHSDRPRDHIALWRLLHRQGRTEEAVALARQHTAPPSDPSEALDYASALSQLGLASASADYLHEELNHFGFDVQLWRLQARNYVSLKNWDELRNLAVRMRNAIPLQGSLEGFSSFLEGFADAATDRPESAAGHFQRAIGESFGNPELAYEAVLAMRHSGHPQPAIILLNTLTNRAAEDVDFWFQYTVTAAAAKEASSALIGAERAYAISPAVGVHVHNLATALLVNRVQPTRALQLAIQRWKERPSERSAIINHALAQLQNGYTANIEPILNSISSYDLSPDERADFELAWFEYYTATKKYDLARMAFSRLDTRRLFPIQESWVREQLSQMPESQ